uniref:Uncharacterized protein n=2 Tax=Oryza sativa subsp. japonica TaxID=39947 RepID=Q69J46_ORYSJ|nr:hypothetical protein [Oryza sativa Japonica Group]
MCQPSKHTLQRGKPSTEPAIAMRDRSPPGQQHHYDTKTLKRRPHKGRDAERRRRHPSKNWTRNSLQRRGELQKGRGCRPATKKTTHSRQLPLHYHLSLRRCRKCCRSGFGAPPRSPRLGLPATRRPSRAAVAEPPLPHLRTDLRAALRPPRRRRLYSGRCVDIVPPTQPARHHHWPPRHQPPHGRKRHSGCRVTDVAGALTARAAATPEPDRRPATALPPRATAPPQWPCHGRHAVARARAVAAPTRFGGGRRRAQLASPPPSQLAGGTPASSGGGETKSVNISYLAKRRGGTEEEMRQKGDRIGTCLRNGLEGIRRLALATYVGCSSPPKILARRPRLVPSRLAGRLVGCFGCPPEIVAQPAPSRLAAWQVAGRLALVDRGSQAIAGSCVCRWDGQ